MGLILCATRGGEASIPTQLKAIEMASQTGDELAFLYVADSSFLNMTAAAVVVDVEDELVNMGKFLLAMAAERAQKEGVMARSVIRTGVVREILPVVAKELEASVIILGRPAGESSQFKEADFDHFMNGIEAETQAKVIAFKETIPE